MNLTTQLDKLFSEWQSTPGHEKSFVRDGIIDESRFHQRRVLFLCKEPNQSESVATVEKEGFGDFRTWWKDVLWGTFSHNLSTWAFGVLNDFVPYDEAVKGDRVAALRSIAFMNVKKSGGLGEADTWDLSNYVGEHKSFIEREVGIIQPSLIVASINCSTFEGILFDKTTRQSTGHGIDIYEWLGVPVIDFYHPTLRGGVFVVCAA